MCNEYELLINKAIDHELSQDEEEKLVAHLQTCKACNEEYKALMQLKAWLGNMEESELPEDFHETLMTRINKEAESTKKLPESRKQPVWRIWGGVAAGLFIGCALFAQLGHLGLKNQSSSMADTAKYEAAEAPAVEEAPSEANVSAQEEPAYEMADAGESADEATGGSAQNSTFEPRKIETEEEDLQNWEIEAADVSTVMQQVVSYLEEQQIAYEIEENKLIIHLSDEESKKFFEWLNTQEIAISSNEEAMSSGTVVLTFMVS